ncbi:MAG: hypothetical protein MHM6MM_005333 [Cercozoa sp. M6MM]
MALSVRFARASLRRAVTSSSRAMSIPLDAQYFRADEMINELRESQTKRFAADDVLAEAIRVDEEWRNAIFAAEQGRKQQRELAKRIGLLMRQKGDSEARAEAEALKGEVAELKTRTADLQKTASELENHRIHLMRQCGNIVHDSVPVSQDESDNEETHLYSLGRDLEHERQQALALEKLGDSERHQSAYACRFHHHEVLHMLGGADLEAGAAVAGHRGYYLTGKAAALNMALQQYATHFLVTRGYSPVLPPLWMRREVMAQTAQLSQFEEELFQLHPDSHQHEEEEMHSRFLIATSEQPLSAMHRSQRLQRDTLPLRYAGVSPCFRKEAGAHGRDAWGIFRVHQFDKVESFVLCAPEESWQHHEEMMRNAQDFYETLELPYRVVNLVSGELNNAAAKKLDLEAWFPARGEYRELVSCSNCTDYQSRMLDVRIEGETGEYVHMLNSTLCATTRTICALLENHQCHQENGVKIPKPLRPFLAPLLGVSPDAPEAALLTFEREPPRNKNADKMRRAASKKKQAREQH